MAFTKEYTATYIFTKDTIEKAERAQRVIWDSGIVDPDEDKLAQSLGAVGTILGLYMASTAAGLAATVIGLVTAMSYNEKDAIEDMVEKGYWGMGYIEDFLDDHPEYDRVEVTLPFIEYETAGVRFVTGEGLVKRVHAGSGWILL